MSLDPTALLLLICIQLASSSPFSLEHRSSTRGKRAERDETLAALARRFGANFSPLDSRQDFFAAPDDPTPVTSDDFSSVIKRQQDWLTMLRKREEAAFDYDLGDYIDPLNIFESDIIKKQKREQQAQQNSFGLEGLGFDDGQQEQGEGDDGTLGDAMIDPRDPRSLLIDDAVVKKQKRLLSLSGRGADHVNHVNEQRELLMSPDSRDLSLSPLAFQTRRVSVPMTLKKKRSTKQKETSVH